MTKPCTTRCQVSPSKKCFWARKTKLLTVLGASLASRSAVIFPHEVSMTTVYFMGGGAVNVGRLGLSGGLVSLHCTAARAGFTAVLVVGPLAVVVVDAAPAL